MNQQGITQYRLAKNLGISGGHLGDWKKGKSRPTIDNLIKIADYFDVSVDYLLGRTENPKINL